MRPRPFKPEILHKPCYVKDRGTGKIWHRSETRTLYVDTDRSQVVYHANYLRYFEFGRASLMREAKYPYKEIEESGFIYPIIKTELNYYSPLFYDDLIYIHTRPGSMELVKLQFDYLITRADNGEICCTGYTKHCAVNDRHIPVEIDQKTINLWKEFPHS
ncbi:MAG: thioesterase family protein [Desulfopila sp.]|jgi:acyl-CoA thioester hydrolase|nr:thioesterase family protein [Desulfopila sp.]